MIAIIALILFILIIVYVALGRRPLKVLSNDSLTLISDRFNLSGRPDRLILLRNGTVVPLEFKHRRTVREAHKIQLAVYLILIEEHYGRRPPFGIIETADGKQTTVTNSARLRRAALAMAERLRSADLDRPFRVQPNPRKCMACGLRADCTQRRA